MNALIQLRKSLECLLYRWYFFYKRKNRKYHFRDPLGPIEQAAWAGFVIDGKEHSKAPDGPAIGSGPDIRCVGREVSTWSERQGHILTTAMISGVFSRGVETLIIGNGIDGRLECPAEVKHDIQKNGISEVLVAKTLEACRLFNTRFRQGKAVALLAHGTC